MRNTRGRPAASSSAPSGSMPATHRRTALRGVLRPEGAGRLGEHLVGGGQVDAVGLGAFATRAGVTAVVMPRRAPASPSPAA